MRTCQNPTGQCLQDLRGLEGRLKAELGGAGSVGFLGSELWTILGSTAWGLSWDWRPGVFLFFLIPLGAFMVSTML